VLHSRHGREPAALSCHGHRAGARIFYPGVENMFLDHGAGQYDCTVQCEREGSPVPGRVEASERNGHWTLKRGMDLVLGLLLLVLALPFICLAALLVKLSSRGPAFYSQVRLGLGGAPFHIWKLRTMYHNCERLSGPCWSTGRDTRITPIGRLLRRTHIDELPQPRNVLRGEMSLVGPRPERPELIPALEQKIPGYRGRLEVRPGMTGLAQIQLPADTELESVRRKLVYDLYYVRQLSLGLDLGILMATPCYLMRVPFSWSSRIFRVPGAQDIESCPHAEGSVAVEEGSAQPLAASAQ
jgi:lipopolysaccharide/colanic/teichoic acid biosynthesis glycosyltransferase